MVKSAVSFVADEQCLSATTNKLVQRRRVISRTVSSPAPTLRDSVSVADFPTLVSTWLATGEIEKHSPQTIDSRKERTGRLLWFVLREGYKQIGVPELHIFATFQQRKENAGRSNV